MKPVQILRIIAGVVLASAVPLVTEATPLSGTSLTPAARTTTAADGFKRANARSQARGGEARQRNYVMIAVGRAS